MKLRAAISLILFAGMLYFVSGNFVVFKLQQFMIKKEIKQRIKSGVPESELVKIKIPREWEDVSNSVFQRIHKGEFRYRGEMFDIVKTEYLGDSILFHCIPDKKETTLFAQLDKLTREDNTQNPERSSRIASLLKILSQPYIISNSEIFDLTYQNGQCISLYCFNVKSWSFKPITPPPESSLQIV